MQEVSEHCAVPARGMRACSCTVPLRCPSLPSSCALGYMRRAVKASLRPCRRAATTCTLATTTDLHFEACWPVVEQEVNGHRAVPALKACLQLYSSVTLPKLAALPRLGPHVERGEASLRTVLMGLKAKSLQLRHSGAPTANAAAGTLASAADLDFYVDVDPTTVRIMWTDRGGCMLCAPRLRSVLHD